MVKCSGIYVIIVTCVQERVSEDEQSRHIIVTVVRKFGWWFSGEEDNVEREDKEGGEGEGDSSSCDFLH